MTLTFNVDLNRVEVTLVVLFDMPAAFDTVSHEK